MLAWPSNDTIQGDCPQGMVKISKTSHEEHSERAKSPLQKQLRGWAT